MHWDNYTHVFFNKFPEELTETLMNYYRAYGIGEGVEPSWKQTTDSYSVGKWYPFSLKNKVLDWNGMSFGISFLVSYPNIGLYTVHTDRRRDFAFNVPIKVDNEKSKVLVMADDDLSKCGPMSTELGRDGHEGHYWHEAVESNFSNLNFQAPMLLNTSKPHSWTNYSNELRVVATLSAYRQFTVQDVYQAFKEYI
jgi:hypothetical protein